MTVALGLHYECQLLCFKVKKKSQLAEVHSHYILVETKFIVFKICISRHGNN